LRGAASLDGVGADLGDRFASAEEILSSREALLGATASLSALDAALGDAYM
jgi:hypothetical protein